MSTHGVISDTPGQIHCCRIRTASLYARFDDIADNQQGEIHP